MANVAEHWGSAGADGPFAADLLNPVALEARLVEARARRSRALAAKKDAAPGPLAALRDVQAPARRSAARAWPVALPIFLAGLVAGAVTMALFARAVPHGAAPAPHLGLAAAALAPPADGALPALPRGGDPFSVIPIAALVAPGFPTPRAFAAQSLPEARPVPSRRCHRLEIPHGGCAGLGFGVDPRRPHFRQRLDHQRHCGPSSAHRPQRPGCKARSPGPFLRHTRRAAAKHRRAQPAGEGGQGGAPAAAETTGRPPRAFAKACQDKGTSWPRRRAAWQRMGTRPRSVEPACPGAGPIRTRLLRQGRAARQLRQGRVARQLRQGGSHGNSGKGGSHGNAGKGGSNGNSGKGGSNGNSGNGGGKGGKH